MNNKKEIKSVQSEKLREMVTVVSNNRGENNSFRQVVRVIDNNTPRIMCSSEMVHYVDKPCTPKTKVMNNAVTIAEKPLFYAESSLFDFNNDTLFRGNTPFLNCNITIAEIIHSENQDYYKCMIYLKGEHIIKDIKASDFSLGKWLFGIAGVSTIGDRIIANQCLYQYLSYLVLNLDLKNKVTLYQKPGWQIIDNKYYYVTQQGVINGSFIKANSKHGQNFNKIEPNYDMFAKYVSSVGVTSSSAAAILVLYTAMSLCNTLFRKANFTPKFLLFVYGLRGNFKTSLSLALSQIEYRDTPLFTLKATKAGIESGFRDYRDAVMLVDDLAPTQELSDRRKMQSTLETIIRAFGDGTSHRRCVLQYSDDKAAKIGQYEAEGGCVITGEYVSGCESSLARCLFVELKKEDVSVDFLSSIQNDRHCVENFAVCFISCLMRLKNDYCFDVIGFIERRGKELRKQYNFKFSNERYAEYLSQLMVTSELLMLVAERFQLLQPQEILKYSNLFFEAIFEVISNNNVRLVAQSPITVLCQALKTAIEDEKVYYCTLGSIAPDHDNVIFYDDNCWYISQKCCAKLVNKYIKENDISLAEFTSTGVATVLESNHIITAVMEGASKRMAMKLPGYGSKRFMKLNRMELNKHIKQ